MSVLDRDAKKRLFITTTKELFVFESNKYRWHSENAGVSVNKRDETAHLFFPWNNIVFIEVDEVEE